MPKPQIFISSAHKNLRHVRAALGRFVESLGFTPVLSEEGHVTYLHDKSPDRSCLRAVTNASIFVLIVGNRYGSRVGGPTLGDRPDFYERYDSVTRMEFQRAVAHGMPIYVLIAQEVAAEYETFCKNRERTDIEYAHANSVEVFHLIEACTKGTRRYPMATFETHSDIELWLRDQWAGLFWELLHRDATNEQLKPLREQVRELKASNDTLKAYLEYLIEPKDVDAAQVVTKENERLRAARRDALLRENALFNWCETRLEVPKNKIQDAFRKTESMEQLGELLSAASRLEDPDVVARKWSSIVESRRARNDADEIREILKKFDAASAQPS